MHTIHIKLQILYYIILYYIILYYIILYYIILYIQTLLHVSVINRHLQVDISKVKQSRYRPAVAQRVPGS